jgi:uncharacterized protein
MVLTVVTSRDDEARLTALTIILNHYAETDLTIGNHRGTNVGISMKSAQYLIESRIMDAAGGDADAYFDLGMAYSCGSGVEVDLIEAHKWFNLAAVNGDVRGQELRAEVSEDMTAREIAEAQRQARAWLSAHSPMRQAA